ncbi:hypothetical protein DPMN_136256 [Dreissena polymorpha]|uniref:Uncharacterized protein n=1 Tax=Dreissena polymorpha TaxID=45954 RepID=A0A9D4FZN2_DREPO|nr:hypothetical protein DPMN_136256 [Dreissena polymorpha]
MHHVNKKTVPPPPLEDMKNSPPPGGYASRRTVIFFELIRAITRAHVLTKCYKDWNRNVTSTVNHSPPPDGNDFKVKTAPPPGYQKLAQTNQQTNQPTNQQTNQQTGQKQYVPHYYK